MGLTSALYSTLTGLNANQARLDVIGNNISNVNTIGYKSSRLDFQTLFSQTTSSGGAPSDDSGGTNPIQIGLGTKEGGVTRNFTSGSRQGTGVSTELAIQGDGFFILQQGKNQVYTRDGTFKLNSENKLVNASGYLVQGYGVDSSFNVKTGATQDITIPLGKLVVASATTKMTLGGELNGSGPVATTGAYLTQQTPFYLAGAGVTPSATAPANTDLLTNIVDDTNVAYFNVGETVTVQPPGKSLDPKTLDVTSTTTLQDYMNFLAGTLGIDTNTGENGAAADGGVGIQAVSPASATFPANSMQLYIRGNVGTVNDIDLDGTSILVNGASKFTFDKVSAADGESSAAPQTNIYDSLGTKLNVNISTTLVGRNSTGTTWQFYVTSSDGTTGASTGGIGTNAFVGSGTLSFDVNGKLISSSTPNVIIDRSGTGAVPLLQFGLSFDQIQALSVSGASGLTGPKADGSAPGNLNDFSIGDDGIVSGTFSNGQKRTLGQVTLATFANNQGLVDAGNNAYVPGANSGLPQISAPGQFSTGTLVAGNLELSNVDLSQEFVNLISASTGFSASSRIITTSNQLLQELLQSAR